MVGYDIEVPLGDERLAYRGRVPAFARIFPAHTVNNEILGLASRIVVLPLVFLSMPEQSGAYWFMDW